MNLAPRWAAPAVAARGLVHWASSACRCAGLLRASMSRASCVCRSASVRGGPGRAPGQLALLRHARRVRRGRVTSGASAPGCWRRRAGRAAQSVVLRRVDSRYQGWVLKVGGSARVFPLKARGRSARRSRLPSAAILSSAPAPSSAPAGSCPSRKSRTVSCAGSRTSSSPEKPRRPCRRRRPARAFSEAGRRRARLALPDGREAARSTPTTAPEARVHAVRCLATGGAAELLGLRAANPSSHLALGFHVKHRAWRAAERPPGPVSPVETFHVKRRRVAPGAYQWIRVVGRSFLATVHRATELRSSRWDGWFVSSVGSSDVPRHGPSCDWCALRSPGCHERFAGLACAGGGFGVWSPSP